MSKISIKGNAEGMIILNVLKTIYEAEVTLSQVVSRIKSEEFKPLIIQIRDCEKKEKRSVLKKSLPAFTLALSKGLGRKKSEFISSDFFLLDFDDFEGPDEVDLRLKEIIKDKEVVLAFKSPSGGLKVAFKLSETITDSETFSHYYKEVMKIKEDLYGLKPDTTSDCLRLCYFSWDPDIYYNSTSKLLDISKLSLPVPVPAKAPVRKRGRSAISKPIISRNIKAVVKKISKSLIERVIDFLVAYKTTYAEWIKIAFYLCSLDNGEELFIRLTVNNDHFDDSEDDASEKFDSLMDNYDPKTYPPSIHGVLIIAKKYGFSNPYFYSYNEKNDSVFIEMDKFYLELIPTIGVFYYGNELALCKNNIIIFIELRELKNLVINEIKELNIDEAHIKSLVSQIIRSDAYIFARGKLDYIKQVKVEQMRSTKTSAYLFFRNCWLEITKDSIIKRDLDTLPHQIFAEHIIDRDYCECEFDTDFNFYKFLINITSDYKEGQWVRNNDRLESLMTALAYLIHTYKERGDEKAIVLIDEINEDSIDSQANGGTGKGILATAVSKMVHMTNLSGKKLKNSSNFMYQKVTNFTQVLNFNDISKNFDVEDLYEVITDNLEVEGKCVKAFDLKYEKSPKVIITTNRVLGADDTSTVRRLFEVVLSHYYDANRNPKKEFGEVFLDEDIWGQENWNKFHQLIITCLQIYLTKGLVSIERSSYHRDMLSNTNKSFIDFCEKFVINQRYLKKDEFNEFKKRFPNNSNMTAIKFKTYLDTYARAKGYQAKHTESNGKSYVEFSEKGQLVSQRAPVDLKAVSCKYTVIDSDIDEALNN